MRLVWTLILASSFLILSCTKVDTGSAGAGGPPNIGGSHAPVGVVDPVGFWVRHRDSNQYDYNTHKGTSTFTTDCSASAGESATCYLDGQELDLYYSGTSLQFNVPKGMCYYFSQRPYWYERWQTAYGPNSIQYDIDKNGHPGLDNNNDGTIDAVATINCPYDYSKIDSTYPNCCLGDYVKTVRTWNANTNSYDTQVSNETWGDITKIIKCFDGPALRDTLPKLSSGYPASEVITNVLDTGINDVYKIEAPINLNFGSTVYISNYYNTADHAGVMPLPISDILNWFTYSTAPDSYRFRCYDRAHEVIAEINLYIREWNTKAAFEDRVNNPSNYDVTGLEPAPFSGDLLNDFHDWKDFQYYYDNFPLLYPLYPEYYQ